MNRKQSPALRFALTYFVDRSDHIVLVVAIVDIFSFRELQLALPFVSCADQRETSVLLSEEGEEESSKNFANVRQMRNWSKFV
ncbi:hypothetical protein NL676_029484 [Syzygium grande]|nr:hypothetical protein NL676_029484 [Syzygium grande]